MKLVILQDEEELNFQYLGLESSALPIKLSSYTEKRTLIEELNPQEHKDLTIILLLHNNTIITVLILLLQC